jgi:hypothetical protein
MGLDFSHCDARWAYSGFKRFRNRIAEQIGFTEYDLITATDDPRFENIKKDPIRYLLAHSDCDGHIPPGQAKKLAPRLRELVATWKDDDYDKKQALELADGLEIAASNGESLRFE